MWTYRPGDVPGLGSGRESIPQADWDSLGVQSFTNAAYQVKEKLSRRTGGLPDILTTQPASMDFTFAEAGIVIDLSKYFNAQWRAEI